MTNFEKLKNMTPEQIAAEFMIFRPSDACFDDENRNYYALDGSWHRYSQDCFQANVKWLNEEIPKDPQDYIKELEAENKQLRRERDQAVEELHRNTDAVPVVRCKDCVYKASAEVIDGFLICPASGMEICDDDFCSYGKRKESNE
ncbi:MAG: hypothetical protein ACLUTK_12745 [[Clostridium] leptum]|mgnify:FL=1